jgi:phosphoglycerate kinase
MQIRTIKQVRNIAGKRVLLRADFNVPVVGGSVMDDFRIRAGLRTLRYLLKQQCRILIVSHLGRPEGRVADEYSLEPVATRLGELLGQKVVFTNEMAPYREAHRAAKPDQVVLFENIRFYPEELEDDKNFSQRLSKLADIYVNDAFSVSHRKHASVSAIKRYLPGYAGLLLADEVDNLNKILRPKPPMVAILGGAKIKTKLPLLENLSKITQCVLTGGVLANDFIAALGYETGKSKVEAKDVEGAAKVYKKTRIILPVDVVVSTEPDGKGGVTVRNLNDISRKDYIYDIGPKTIKLYSSYIKGGETLVWNGPMGMFEHKSFKHGTLAVARLIASRSRGKAFGVIGGGETVAALQMTKMFGFVDWVSTGGGAMLAYLGKEKMPGLAGIVR